jgi:hypothetical protein
VPEPIRIAVLEPRNGLQRYGGRAAPLLLSPAAAVAPRRRAHIAEFAELPAINAGSTGPAGAGLVGTGTAAGAGGSGTAASAGGTGPV